ncbi:purine catabolism protein PucB [Corallococcus sp. H22C18031201]|uniref:nucleotidyltransferase family protein n=1 Tax=Citreicoccus inhibens TaxID=2849499 RepID=UPI000E7507B9|nr:NTP transferase domain-containing protein [Citreicoccus inhibens]MBU8900151.1 NTP transferase domain-containing protein [Citreicoccus inhibens]RJS21790.1 purine catabolism protein PucB [Corallococcus sp. H22C18031201]
MKAVAIILAAGEARRMSYPKALIEHEGGKSFLQSLASTFGKAGCMVMAVLGKDAEAVREQHPGLELVDSERWQEGPLASIRTGLDAALEAGADVVMLHPVDMPAVRASTLKSLLKMMAESEEPLRPEFEGAPGWPLVLSRSAAQRVLAAEGSQLEPVLATLKPRRVAVKDPGVVVNINTPETYERLFGGPPRLAPPPKRRGTKRMGPTTTTVADIASASAPLAAASDE